MTNTAQAHPDQGGEFSPEGNLAGVLADVSHDLANRFHRSHYMVELLGEAVGEAGGEAASLLERLAASLDEMEELSRGALQLVRPLELSLLRVQGSDLLQSFCQQLPLDPASRVEDPVACAMPVAIDPARIAQVLRVMADEAQSGSAPELKADGGAGLVLSVACAQAATAGASRGLAFALAARIAGRHGGSLRRAAERIELRLPAAGEGQE